MKTRFDRPTDTTITYEREFSAAPEKVWEAYTRPELLRTWLGYGEFVTCEMDIRPGGSFRWVWQLPEFTMGIHGEVLEVEAPRLLVTTEHMTDTDYPPTTNTVELEPLDGGGTLMRTRIEYASVEARDGAWESGMASGVEDSFTTLDGRLD